MTETTKFSRVWAIPSGDTFSIPPIRDFVERHLDRCRVIVDPFARNAPYGSLTNDLNPETEALWHMDARDFCEMLLRKGVKADAVIFDPPYSPRQISDCYKQIGRKVSDEDTRNFVLHSECRRALRDLLKPNGIALSFGWNSCKFADFETVEILLVAHGGSRNDTICVASRKPTDFIEF